MGKLKIILPTELHSAWYNIETSDWLIWMLDKTNQISITIDFAIQLGMLEMPLIDGKRVIDIITDSSCLTLIKMKKQYLSGTQFSATQWTIATQAACLADIEPPIGAKTRYDLASAYAMSTWGATGSVLDNVASAFAWYSPRTTKGGTWDAWGDSETYSKDIARKLQADIIRDLIKLAD